MGAVAAMGKTIAKCAEQYFNAQDDVKRTIFKHSCIGGAIALIPIPVAGEVAVVINQIAMYREINRLVGIRFSENILKNIGKFLISQLAGVGVGMAALIGVTAVAKIIPGLNFLAGIAQAPAAGVANYVCGIAYYRMLGKYIQAGGGSDCSEEEVIRLLKNSALSREELARIKNEAARQMDNADYSAYQSEAKTCTNQAAQRSC